MKSSSIEELNEDFDATLDACSNCVLNGSDEMVSRLIFEEFDVGVTSFLHHSSLERLVDAGYIDGHIKDLSTRLREQAMFALKNHRSVADVRNNDCWAAVVELSDRIKLLKKERRA